MRILNHFNYIYPSMKFKDEDKDVFLIKRDVENYLNSRRDDIENKKYFPTPYRVIGAISCSNVRRDYITQCISNWIKTECICGASNLSELKRIFGILSDQESLNIFLDSKLELIKLGLYFPTKLNLNKDFQKCKKFVTIQKMVSNWMKLRNLPFENVTEMMIYFKKKDKITLLEKVYRFLDSKLEEINDLEYIPTYRSVIQDLGIQFDEHYIIKWFRSRYKKERVNFQNLNELKLKAGLFKNAEVKKFLDSKRSQIKKLEFLPTTGNIIQERPDLRYNPRLNKATGEWLQQNNLPSITQLRELADQEPIKVKLGKILDSRKQEIKNYIFLPTVENIEKFTNEFDDKELLREYINRWLRENDISENLTEYLYSIGIMSNAKRLKEFLNSKYAAIISGNYFPTRQNLRKDQDKIRIDIDSYSNLDNVRWEWFKENINKTMTQLIDEFNPTYKQLGLKLYDGYPPKFKSQKLKIFNAILQTVIIKNRYELLRFNPTKIFSSLERFINYIDKKGHWKFIDMLTGEIFTLQYLYNGIIDLHHINFIKTDLRLDNLVFLFRDNHNIITQSKHHFKVLCDFLTTLLHENIESLMQNRIPESWIVGWRKLASQEGIRLPSKRYIQRYYRPTIMEYFQSQKKIDSF